MHPSEIQVGVTYRCYGRWMRKVTKIRASGMVEYTSWVESKEERLCYPTPGHIDWFSRNAIAAISNGNGKDAA